MFQGPYPFLSILVYVDSKRLTASRKRETFISFPCASAYQNTAFCPMWSSCSNEETVRGLRASGCATALNMDSETSTVVDDGTGTSSLLTHTSSVNVPPKLESFTLPPTGSAASFVLPSIHAWPPFFTYVPPPNTPRRLYRSLRFNRWMITTLSGVLFILLLRYACRLMAS